LWGVFLDVIVEILRIGPVSVDLEAIWAGLLNSHIIPFLGREHLLECHLLPIILVKLRFRVLRIRLAKQCGFVVVLDRAPPPEQQHRE